MLKIIAVFTLAAVAFGLVHDQITARVCMEYFTIAHVTIVPTQSPLSVIEAVPVRTVRLDEQVRIRKCD